MPVIIDEVTADITPPPRPPPARAPGARENTVPPDPDALRRELVRMAERAERTKAF